MKNDDTDLKAYFNAIKEKDKQTLKIPAFQLPAKRSNSRKLAQYLFPISIAACLVLLCSIVNFGPEVKNEEETVVITVIQDNTLLTDVLLEEKQTITSWEAPTDILINEFEN